MPLNSAVRQCIAENLVLFEGKTDHLYLDTNGYPTIGIGHCVANLAAFTQLAMIRISDGEPASEQEKIAEYQTIKQKPAGYNASWYHAFCKLRLPEQTINSIHEEHLRCFHHELRQVFKRSRGYNCDFEQLPSPVQIALFDLAYNVGTTNLQHKWPKLHQAIKQQNWQLAAQESNRKGIQAARNEHIKSLFLSAAGKKPMQAPQRSKSRKHATIKAALWKKILKWAGAFLIKKIKLRF